MSIRHICPATLILGHFPGNLISAQRFTIRAHYVVCAVWCRSWRSLSVLLRPRESAEFPTQNSSELPRSPAFLVRQPPHPSIFQGYDLYPALAPTCSYHSPRISVMILHMFRLHGPKGGVRWLASTGESGGFTRGLTIR